MKTLTFRTETQAALFQNELCGQISDGQWENLQVKDHWQIWCDATIEVGPVVGRDFWATYDRYNFAAKDLLDVVGRRMLSYARLTLAFGREHVEALDGLLYLDGKFRGLSTHEGAYWDKIKAATPALLLELGTDMEAVEAVVNDETAYDMKDLRKELTEMKKAIKISL